MSEYMALYRKYRPAVFSDVVGQDHITRVLRSEVMQDSVSHAYLFCGSRGTGKTTGAKILAKAANCLQPIDGDPCGVCERCRAFETTFDIVELDAASHNGVDNIRELQDKISFLPIEMKSRVYIIEEVHMLSPCAFNALLKTLEEPPSHVMFILATTESHKIPATILSRCKHFDFHRINTDDITKRLEYVSEKEGIEIERDALKLISLLATGAMRDALSMLELFVGGKGITREIAEKSLGVVGNEIVLKLLRFIADRNAAGALETIADSYNSSKDPAVLCSELGNMLRNLLIMKCASGSVSSLIDECADVIETLR
ncbi:MAG: DNA polymerase III subunit gamma/tau, partial [Clostridia bacterium]|nr:DNA polymerase III subunit gamma/tau [Clostridia bacterium]